MPITLEQLDREIRSALRKAGLPSSRARVKLWTNTEERSAKARDHAYVYPDRLDFRFSRKTLGLSAAHRRALVAHEVGHVLEYQRKGKHSENDADRAARRELGVPVCYDKAWPGKGLQVDCRARQRNPAVPFPVGPKPKVPYTLLHTAAVTRVRVVDLVATQAMVSDHGLNKYESTTGKPPMVARQGGRLYILDGHHRCSSAWARGDETIDVRLVDLEAPMRDRNPPGASYAVLATDDHQWPALPVRVATRDEALRSQTGGSREWVVVSTHRDRDDAEKFARTLETTEIEVSRADGTVVFRGPMLEFSKMAPRAPYFLRYVDRGRLLSLATQNEAKLGQGKKALMARRVEPANRNPRDRRTKWVRVPGQWLAEGMVVKAPKWVDYTDPEDGVQRRLTWSKFWGPGAPKKLRVRHWGDGNVDPKQDDYESDLAAVDGPDAGKSVDLGTDDYPPEWMVDIDTIDMWPEQREETRRMGVYPPANNPRRNPLKTVFTHDESATVFDVVHECARKVADSMPATAVVFENHHDQDKPESETVAIMMKFVPRAPEQRHLSLVQNPKVKGFTANTSELIRDEFQYCAGNALESMRLVARYDAAKPTSKSVPIRMTITKRPFRQTDLFGNPERKVIAISKDRYRASADERRRYGGSTVTEFYMRFADEPAGAADVVTGYGKTPGERKTDAIRRFRAKRAAAAANPRRRRNGSDPLRKFQSEGWPLRESLHDTGELVPWPVGTVVSHLDRTGYHDEQVVIAHPTFIEYAGAREVGIRNNYGYNLVDESGFFRGGYSSYTDAIPPEDWEPGVKESVAKVKALKVPTPKGERPKHPTPRSRGTYQWASMDDDDPRYVESFEDNPRGRRRNPAPNTRVARLSQRIGGL